MGDVAVTTMEQVGLANEQRHSCDDPLLDGGRLPGRLLLAALCVSPAGGRPGDGAGHHSVALVAGSAGCPTGSDRCATRGCAGGQDDGHDDHGEHGAVAERCRRAHLASLLCGM